MSKSQGTVYSDILYTETCGFMGEFIVLSGLQKSGNGSYLRPLLFPEIPKSLADPNMFDCSEKNYLYLRKSREDNSKIDMGGSSGGRYKQIGIIAVPEKAKIAQSYPLIQSYDDLFFEKLMRDTCEKVLMEHNLQQYEKNKNNGRDIKQDCL